MSFRLDVRRLAAIDMWGSAGVRWRRWVILAEFLLGVVGAGALGVVANSSGGQRAVLGYWLIGLAANYVPLSAHAVSLIRPGALESELRAWTFQANYTTTRPRNCGSSCRCS
ncbi:hypothetical protein [Cryptosporangium minutisporangium]|uniref:Uncharacterized protein n=1 Tax=Cryptosporangium minutisporangium TaxID=113569 RepID=A0ABP6T137_9ACTN